MISLQLEVKLPDFLQTNFCKLVELDENSGITARFCDKN